MSKIKFVQLINCQSWESDIIPLSDGLNIIHANNNSEGKSVFRKILGITGAPQAYSAEERKSLIRYDKEYAQMNVLFDDDSLGSVYIYPNKVVYRYTEDSNIPNPEYEQTVDYPHSTFLRKLNLIVSYSTDTVVNTIKGNGSLFLVTSDNKTNHEILKNLTSHEQLTHLIELFKSKIPELTKANGEVSSTMIRLEHKLEQSEKVDIVKLEDDIDELQTLVDLFKVMFSVVDIVDDLEIKDPIDYDDILAQLDMCNALESTGILNISINHPNVDDYDIALTDLAIELENTLSNLREPKEDLDHSILEDIELAIALENLDNNLGGFNIHDDIDFDTVFDDIKLLETTTELFDSINTIAGIKGNIEKGAKSLAHLETYIELYDATNDIHNTLMNIQTIKGNIETGMTEINKIKDSMQSLYNSNEELKCPVHGSILFVDGKCVPVIEECK